MVAGSSSLTLCAGAILKSSQHAYFDFSNGSVVPPEEGKAIIR